MQNPAYLKNVMLTLSQKPAKLGLKTIGKSTRHTNLFHAFVGIGSETMELVTGLYYVILGTHRYDETFKENALEELGDLGYYLAVARKFMKLKYPSATKKVKLHMSRGDALGQLLKIGNDITDLAKKNFYGPKMTTVTKIAPKTSNKAGTEIQVQVIDKAATEALYIEREVKIATLIVDEFIPLYYALCHDLTGMVPAQVYNHNIAKLAERYKDKTFTLDASETKNNKAEMVAMAAVTKAKTKATATA